MLAQEGPREFEVGISVNAVLICLEIDDKLDVGENKTATHVIVMRLLGSLKKAGHHIYMDNYYTRPVTVCRYENERFGSV